MSVPVDPISGLVELTGVKGEVFCLLEARGPWGLRIPQVPQVGMHVVRSGACWLEVASTGTRLKLEAGDLTLIPQGVAHDMFDEDEARRVPLLEWHAHSEGRRVIRRGGGTGAEVSAFCGGFAFRSPTPHPLLQLLPTVIHMPRALVETHALGAVLRVLEQEITQPQDGGSTVVSRLLDVVLVDVLRAWVAQASPQQVRWLGAFQDGALGPVVSALHEDPARDWSLEEMAHKAGLSRTVFVRRFSEALGMAPRQYLTQVRMDTASRLLRETELGLAEVAARVGYASEFAFSRTFYRELGERPGAWRRRHWHKVEACRLAAQRTELLAASQASSQRD